MDVSENFYRTTHLNKILVTLTSVGYSSKIFSTVYNNLSIYSFEIGKVRWGKGLKKRELKKNRCIF
jgi:hypothetical protein